jgi:hypothetical protein
MVRIPREWQACCNSGRERAERPSDSMTYLMRVKGKKRRTRERERERRGGGERESRDQLPKLSRWTLRVEGEMRTDRLHTLSSSLICLILERMV